MQDQRENPCQRNHLLKESLFLIPSSEMCKDIMHASVKKAIQAESLLYTAIQRIGEKYRHVYSITQMMVPFNFQKHVQNAPGLQHLRDSALQWLLLSSFWPPSGSRLSPTDWECELAETSTISELRLNGICASTASWSSPHCTALGGWRSLDLR